jgi:hypothetical protein
VSVYFILDPDRHQIKIGKSAKPLKRVKGLQTGNPTKLLLMGWISDDRVSEQNLHDKYKDRRELGEWFAIDQDDVLGELQSALYGFVPKRGDPFEIIGHDKDGIPEYIGVCEWAEFEYYECCPYCGCLCGMHFQEASGMYHCLNCDKLTTFDDLEEEAMSWQE